LATAAATLNRTVVVASSPLDACTMKVTALPFCTLHPSASHFGALFSGSRAGNFRSGNFRFQQGAQCRR
jgi:hypothetical protein